MAREILTLKNNGDLFIQKDAKMISNIEDVSGHSVISEKLNVKIRKAKIADIPQLAKLFHELMRQHSKLDRYYKLKKTIEAITRKDIKKVIYSKHKTIFVAEHRNKIIGYVEGSVEKRSTIYIEDKYGLLVIGMVTKKHRRKRIGQALLDKLIKWFKIKKVKHIELEVDARNLLGINAWKKYGFRNYRLKFKRTV